jgi:hypothetical protein
LQRICIHRVSSRKSSVEDIRPAFTDDIWNSELVEDTKASPMTHGYEPHFFKKSSSKITETEKTVNELLPSPANLYTCWIHYKSEKRQGRYLNVQKLRKTKVGFIFV